jgi:hypothetical protein
MIFLISATGIAATWTPAEIISSENADASFAKIRADKKGNMIALWLENGIVKTRTKFTDQPWSAIDTLSLEPSSHPCLEIDSNGNATAIWEEQGVIVTTHKPFSQAWTQATPLSELGAAFPTLAISSSGDMAAVWTRNGNIESRTKLAHHPWPDSSELISTSHASDPCVVFGGELANPTFFLIWHGTENGLNIIYATDKPIAGKWNNPAPISNPDMEAAYPRIAADINGNAQAIWYSYTCQNSAYSNVAVVTVNKPANGIWDSSVVLSRNGLHNPSELLARVYFDKKGNLIAIWSQSYCGAIFNIEASINRTGEQAWTAPFVHASNLYSFFSDLAVTDKGDTFAIYYNFNSYDRSMQICSVQTDAHSFYQNWGNFAVLEQSGLNAYPKIDAALVNDVYIQIGALWTCYQGAHTVIKARTGKEITLQPPTNLTAKQERSDFHFFVDNHNILSWTPSPTPNLGGYLIFRNGVVIGEAAPTERSFVDHNQGLQQPVIYGVAAFDGNCSQSSITTTHFP